MTHLFLRWVKESADIIINNIVKLHNSVNKYKVIIYKQNCSIKPAILSHFLIFTRFILKKHHLTISQDNLLYFLKLPRE